MAPSTLIPWDKTSFGPRVGVVFSLTPKTVFRAAYGIFYGGEENQGGNPNRGENVPFNATVRLDRKDGLSIFDLNDNFSGVSNGFPSNVFSGFPARIDFRMLAQNYRNPLVHKWNVTIQQELSGNQAVEISYIGNHSAHQMFFSDPNACPNDPRPSISCDSRRPYPNIGGVNATTTFGFGNYAGLDCQVGKAL